MSKKTKSTFNPVKEEHDGKIARRMIWSSVALELAFKGLEQGKKLIANPFYENNTKLLKGDLVFERTEDEINEWLKCKNDILYFAEKYCKLLTPEGIKNIHLRDYQKKYLKHLEDNRLSIYLACRQCGKTTTSAIFLLHYICFNVDKNALVLGNKRKTAVEILDKAKKIFTELPYFLRPGIYKWNEAEIVLDNGCRLMAEATTINSGISFTFHCVLADEFAHIAPNIMDKFYNNLFPTITAGRARFIITSTQNGYNLFYRLYMAAVDGINEYSPFKTDWWEVPEWNPDKKQWEQRDEAWHQKQVANYGSEEAFNAQFGTSFDISANTLISQKVINKKSNNLILFENKNLLGVPLSDCYYWDPNYEPMEQLKKDYIIITCDLAEGLGGDYTVFSITKLTDFGFETVGFFRTNTHQRSDCALSIQLLCVYYMNPDKYLLSLEYNTYGELFLNNLYKNMDTNQEISNKFDNSCIVKYYNETGSRYLNGIKLTRGNKTSHCLLFKESFERDQIINNSSQFMTELNKFCDDGSGNYKSSFGHDDMVMSLIQLEFVKKTLQFKLFKDSFNESINNEFFDEKIYNPFDDINYDYNSLMDNYYKRLNGFRL